MAEIITEGTPTQVAHPWRATVRTILASVIGLAVLLPAIIPIINEQLGPWLPDAWEAWLVAAATLITALIGAVTRILVLPGVEEWLAKHLPAIATGVHTEQPQRALPE